MHIHKNVRHVEQLCMQFSSVQFQYNPLASYDFGLFFDMIFQIYVADRKTQYCKELMTRLNKALLNFPDYCVSTATGYVKVICCYHPCCPLYAGYLQLYT